MVSMFYNKFFRSKLNLVAKSTLKKVRIARYAANLNDSDGPRKITIVQLLTHSAQLHYN